MSTFQVFLLMFFAAIGLLAVFAFSGFIPLPGGPNGDVKFGGEVVLWGTLPAQEVRNFLAGFNNDHNAEFHVSYSELNPATFEQDLVSALASGRGPDMVLFPHDLLISQGDKIFPIPYTVYSKRLFQDSFIDEGELYFESEGISALPLYVDPLVMYWNRDLFSSAGIVEPPKTWEQFPALVQKLTLRDTKGNITQSAVALGGIRNIEWQKDILSTLIMQVGDPITELDDQNRLRSTLGVTSGGASPTPAALRFYTEFANPAKTSYSWNSALPNSKDAFEAGTLAVYFGRASDLNSIKRTNPHLNFDVAVMPQREKAQKKVSFAEMSGVAVLRAARNPSTAFDVLFALTTGENSATLSSFVGLPSASRQALSVVSSDPIKDVFDRAAIISRGWYDPSPSQSDVIFADMAESVIINKSSEEGAVNDARQRLDSLFGR